MLTRRPGGTKPPGRRRRGCRATASDRRPARGRRSRGAGPRRTSRRRGRQPRIRVAPDDQRRGLAGDRAPRRLRTSSVSPAEPVQAQDRALRALVELVPDRGDPRVRPGVWVRGAACAGCVRARRESSRPSPARRSAGGATGARLGASGRPERKQRHAVDQHEPLDSLRVALRERESHGRAPIVDDQLDALDPERARGTARRSPSGLRSCSRGCRPCPSVRSRAGRARSRRCARGTGSSRRSWSARRGRRAQGRLGAGAVR